MRCEDIQIHLAEGLKNPQDPTLPMDFRKHLESCADCRDLRLLWQALGEVPVPSPGPGLSARFRERLQQHLPQPKLVPHRLAGWGLPLAAAALLTVGGAFAAGFALRSELEPSNPRQATLARMRRGTPADRMQTIALVTSTRSGDSDLLGALMERVMQDSNVHVRLSAVEALYLFGSDPSLGQRIAEALPRQERPEVQLALVDLVVALQERRAADSLRRLLQEGRLGPEARHRAESRLAEQRL